VVRGWTSRKHEGYWQTIHAKRQVKDFLKRPTAERAGELFNLIRNQLGIMIIITGHYHLKGHLFEPVLADSPKCGRCKQASESPYTSFVTAALTELRFRHLGLHFIKPGDLEDIFIIRILHLLGVWGC
jgi:hypothetical protein